jgi:hypothetical protein
MISTSRRGLITSALALFAAPAIVRAASIMPVKPEMWTLQAPTPVTGALWYDMSTMKLWMYAEGKWNRFHVGSDPISAYGPHFPVNVTSELPGDLTKPSALTARLSQFLPDAPLLPELPDEREQQGPSGDNFLRQLDHIGRHHRHRD